MSGKSIKISLIISSIFSVLFLCIAPIAIALISQALPMPASEASISQSYDSGFKIGYYGTTFFGLTFCLGIISSIAFFIFIFLKFNKKK